MRQVVVLEPAGSVLVIRQTSPGSGVTSVTTATNSSTISNNPHNVHDTHALTNSTVTSIASNDHNQNRIVVVRSASSMTPAVNTLRWYIVAWHRQEWPPMTSSQMRLFRIALLFHTLPSMTRITSNHRYRGSLECLQSLETFFLHLIVLAWWAFVDSVHVDICRFIFSD